MNNCEYFRLVKCLFSCRASQTTIANGPKFRRNVTFEMETHKEERRGTAESEKNENKKFWFYKNKMLLCRPKKRERDWQIYEIEKRPKSRVFSRFSDWLINTAHIWLVYFYPIPNWPAPARRWSRWEIEMQRICFMSGPSIRADERRNARGMIDWAIWIPVTKLETEKV